MFRCYCCGQNNGSVALLCMHLRQHESIGELAHPIRCAQEQCTSTFRTVFWLKRHNGKFHAATIAADQTLALHSPTVTQADLMDLMEIDSLAADSPCVNIEQQSRADIADIEAAGISLVSSLHANSSIPR